MRIAAPKALWPDEDIRAHAIKIAEDTGARVTVSEDLDVAVAGTAGTIVTPTGVYP